MQGNHDGDSMTTEYSSEEIEKLKKTKAHFKRKRHLYFLMFLTTTTFSFIFHSYRSFSGLKSLIKTLVDAGVSANMDLAQCFVLLSFFFFYSLSQTYVFWVRNTTNPEKIRRIVYLNWALGIYTIAKSIFWKLYVPLKVQSFNGAANKTLWLVLVIKDSMPSLLISSFMAVVFYVHFCVGFYSEYYFWLKKNRERIKKGREVLKRDPLNKNSIKNSMNGG